MPAKNAKASFKIKALENVATAFDENWAALQKKFPKLFLSRQTHVDMKTAFYEAAANAIKHARELENKGYVGCRLYLSPELVGFEIEDHGPGYNPDRVPVPDLFDMKSSGRGVFIMKQVGDELKYRKSKSGNVLSFKRFLLGQSTSAREIDLLYDLSEAVIRGASLDEVCQLILEEALKIFKVERASLLIYDDAIKRLKVVASRGLSGEVQEKTRVRAGEGVSGFVFQHGRPLLIEDIDRNVRGLEKKSGYKSGSFISAPMICSPLRIGEKPFGVINLTDRTDGKKFTKKDLKVLSTIANQAMACLYMRDLMDGAKKNETLKQELEIVRNIQTSYLPSAAPRLKGFDIAGDCEMAQSVGGDYFDYCLIDSWLYVVVADVSGHDMKSAMTMFNFRSQLKALFPQTLQPAELLTRMNASMYDDLTRAETFVSALILRIDVKTGEYLLASAGHYPPLFLEGHYELVESGLVLGIEKSETYQNVPGRLRAGEGFLLFTDGVIEAMNQKGQFFGIERLKKTLEDAKHLPSETVVQRVIEKVLTYRTNPSFLDDITVVALKHG
jgi:sigma-B regulation protein RsbU (phosphoserine phosphatase)